MSVEYQFEKNNNADYTVHERTFENGTQLLTFSLAGNGWYILYGYGSILNIMHMSQLTH